MEELKTSIILNITKEDYILFKTWCYKQDINMNDFWNNTIKEKIKEIKEKENK